MFHSRGARKKIGEMLQEDKPHPIQAYLLFLARLCFAFLGTAIVPLCGAEIASAWMLGNSILTIGFISLALFTYYEQSKIPAI
jgi:hypothetical protein